MVGFSKSTSQNAASEIQFFAPRRKKINKQILAPCRTIEMQIWGNRACFLSPSVLRSLFYTLGVMRVSSQEMSLEGNTAAYYCSWKCGLGFWHSGDLFSPGQNGKSDVVSETPTEGQERGGDGMSLKPQGVLWRQGGKVD